VEELRNGVKAVWAIRLLRRSAMSACGLRLRADVDVCAIDDQIILRGTVLDEATERLLRQIPGERFGVTHDGSMIPLGGRIPRGQLPQQPWMPFSKWLALEVQPAATPAFVKNRATLRLVRSSHEQEPNVLVTSLVKWATWAASAARIRLNPLVFAASADDRVVIWGKPLPSLEGERFVEDQCVATPAGFTFEPDLPRNVVRLVAQPPPAVSEPQHKTSDSSDLAIFHPDGSHEVIDRMYFVPASRSAVRMTVGGGMQ